MITIKIDKIALYLQKVVPSANSCLAIIGAMKISCVKYPVRHVEMCLSSISGHVTSWTQENIMLGQLLYRVVFGFTRTNAAHGDYHFNTMHLQHFSINVFSLYGRRISTKVLQP